MGWFREFIAFDCASGAAAPLGVAGAYPGVFRLYEGTRMQRSYRGGPLMLLAPRDPLAFYEAVRGRAWGLVDEDGGCVVPDPRLGSWYHCVASLAAAGPPYDVYLCPGGPRPVALAPWEGYTRVYGCLVELLVVATKALAGAPVPKGYAEGLAWCARRASMGDERVMRAVEWALRAIREAVPGHGVG